MVKADDIETVSDVRLWAVEHDAKIDAAWGQQWKDNAKMEIKMAAMDEDIKTLRTKLIWANGAVSAGMGMIGSAITIAIALWKLNP